MNIAIASGKGCTGKTTIATNLVLSVPNSVYLDCDVEEPNSHLFLNPDMTKWIERFASKIKIGIAGKIPFNENVDRALLAEKNILEFEDSQAAKEISNIWDKVNQLIKP